MHRLAPSLFRDILFMPCIDLLLVYSEIYQHYAEVTMFLSADVPRNRLGASLCRALIVTSFYFGINQWAKILFFYMAAFFQFFSFVVVNIYGSEIIPTSHRALATGIENTVGNVGLFIGDFIALYLIHTNYYVVLTALQGLTIFVIFIISVFVVDSQNVPLSDS